MIDYSILIVGKINTGKSSLIQRISEHFEIPVTSFGYMISNLIQIENPTRVQLQNFGYEKFTTDGAGKILNDAINFSKNENAKNIIFDGVRHKTVLEEIIKISKKTFVVFLEADKKIRYERYRKNFKSNITLEEFQKIDEHPIEQGIEIMKQFSDVVINSSNLTKEAIYYKIKVMIERV